MYSCAYICVCIFVYVYSYVHFLAVNVACTLEQVFWAPVHVQLYAFIQMFLWHQRTHLQHIRCRLCACGYMHIYVYMHAHVYGCVCTSMILFDASRCCCWDFLSLYRCAFACMCICVCMYACICAGAYVCICIYVCLRICMHIHPMLQCVWNQAKAQVRTHALMNSQKQWRTMSSKSSKCRWMKFWQKSTARNDERHHFAASQMRRHE